MKKLPTGFTSPIILVVIGLIVVVSITFVYFQIKSKTAIQPQQTTDSQIASSPTPINVKNVDLKDNISELIYADNNKIYSYKLDGSEPKLLVSIKSKVTSLYQASNTQNLVITTDNPAQIWLSYKRGHSTTEPLDLDSGSFTTYLDKTINASFIRTKENPDGGADIIMDKLDGDSPTKIGHLNKAFKNSYCKNNTPDCFYFPDYLIASFDNSLMINSAIGSGGPGIDATIFSSDGSKVYITDFYWYVSQAIWIDNNKLLTHTQDKSNTYTFFADGKNVKENFPSELTGELVQKGVSTSRKYLMTYYQKTGELYIVDLNKLTRKLVDKSFNHYNSKFIGWNKGSDKFFYIQNDDLLLYDLPLDKVSNLGKMNKSIPSFVIN